MTRQLRTHFLIAAATAAAVVGSAPALAQSPAASAATAATPRTAAPARPAWQALSAQQRTALAPLERDWGMIDAPRKAKWLEVASRFPAMPAADQQRLQERMAEWARMTPVERGRARLSFQESKLLSPEQKQARWEAYQALPDEERKALAVRAKPVEERARGAAAPVSATPSASAAAAARAPAGPKAATPAALAKPVAPTLVQAKPGATTTLMTAPVLPPTHHRPGEPKIAAQPGQVNPATLLPQSGPQAAAAAAPAVSASARQP